MNYLIYGMGTSGMAAADLLLKKGQNVYYYDDNKKTEHSLEELEGVGIDRIILSPGIPKSKIPPQLSKAEVLGDIELYYELHPEQRSIAITGTNGKSTVTALISAIFDDEGQMGGNIGLPICALAEDEEKTNIIEISSFQLDLLDEAEFTLSILLNITPDHLDRHGSFEEYVKSKSLIFKHSNIVLVNYDCPLSRTLGERFAENTIFVSAREHLKEGYYLIGDNIYFGDELVMPLPSCSNLQGEHNITNILFACSAAYEFCIDENQIASKVADFRALAHRMELVYEASGVQFINDSKATNSDAAVKALKSFNNIHWLAGGIYKEDSTDNLKDNLANVKKSYFFGEAADKFVSELGGENCNNLEQAIENAKKNASNGDVILLSPACSSFDQFTDFKERGEKFKELAVSG